MQRYKFFRDDQHDCFCDVEESNHGAYVLYDDHLVAIESLEADKQALVEALEQARQFIANGIEFGYISMPDPETPDSAHDTLPMIEKALAQHGESK